MRQGQLYLWMAWPAYEQIVFIYESKFHQQTKEFVVDYNKSFIAPMLETAKEVSQGVRAGVAPDRPDWATGPEGKVCASCPYRLHAGASMPLKKRVIRPSSESNEPSRQLVSAPFGRPKFEVPELPDDITFIDDERLMSLFSQYVQWQNYAATEFAAAEVEEERGRGHVKRLEAQHMVVNWGAAKDKVTLARAQRLSTRRSTRPRTS